MLWITGCLRNLQTDNDGNNEIDGVLNVKLGVISRLAIKLAKHRSTIQRVWNRARNGHNVADTAALNASTLRKNGGRKQKFNRNDIISEMKNLAFSQRNTYRKLSVALGISLATLHRICKDKSRPNVIRSHTNAVKPLLTEEGRFARLLYAINHLQLNSPDQPLFSHEHMDPEKIGFFDGWFDQVHIDKKWFFVTMKMLRVYLTEGELGPVQRVQHKEHIEKVMFLSAVARPRFDEDGTCIFDGKIGTWPFVKSVQALRSSVNRPAGTWETKCVKVTKAVYAAMIIDKVIPAIRLKWLDGNKTVYIQQVLDNASISFSF